MWVVTTLASAVAVLLWCPGGAVWVSVCESVAITLLLAAPVAATLIHRSLRVLLLVVGGYGLLVFIGASVVIFGMGTFNDPDRQYQERRMQSGE